MLPRLMIFFLGFEWFPYLQKEKKKEKEKGNPLRVLGAYRTLFSYDYITFNQTKGFEKIPHKKKEKKII